MSKESLLIFLLFWTAALTAVVGYLFWDFMKFKGVAVLQHMSEKLKTDMFVVPTKGVFALKKKHSPRICDDLAAFRVEQEKKNRVES